MIVSPPASRKPRRPWTAKRYQKISGSLLSVLAVLVQGRREAGRRSRSVLEA
jgi:hypothetical protein